MKKLPLEYYSKVKYCSKCGKQLVPKPDSFRYDRHTGKPEYLYYKCPDFKSWFTFNNGHDDEEFDGLNLM